MVFVTVLTTASALAFAQGEKWEADLQRQLLAEHDCELNYLTGARTFELLGRETIKARAHCMDKRAFDVTRAGDEKTFQVQSCSISEC